MQLPAISSLVSLLTTSISGIKDLFKPITGVAAVYFILLQLVIVFPPLRDSSFAPILAFAALPTVWQLALGALILLLLSFLLNVGTTTFLNLVNGRTLHELAPWLDYQLTLRQKKHFEELWQKLVDTIDAADNSDWEAEDAADRLAYDYPDEARDLVSMKLGNILLSPASYTYRQYGARLDTIWPILAKKVDKDFVANIDSEMESITFLATMSVLSLFVAVEAIPVTIYFANSYKYLLWFPVLLVLAFVFYYATFPKARAWGMGIRAAFDQSLALAAKELGLRELDDPLARQQQWREVSAWLSIGALRNRPPEDLGLDIPARALVANTDPAPADFHMKAQDPLWYKKAGDAASPVTVKKPENISVSVHQAVVDDPDAGSVTNQLWRKGRQIHYVLAATNSGKKPVAGAYLQVTDERLPALPTTVNGNLGAATGDAQEGICLPASAGQPDSLLWFLPPIPAAGTVVLRYELNSEISISIPRGTGAITEDDPTGVITITPKSATTLTINVMNREQLAPLYDTGGQPLEAKWDTSTTPALAVETAEFATSTTPVKLKWDGQRLVPWLL